MRIKRLGDLGIPMMDAQGSIVTAFANNSFLKEYFCTWGLTRQQKLNPNNIEKVIFNPPATIVIFKDGTKVVSKAHKEDFDEEKGFMACMMRIMFNSRGEFDRLIEKGKRESYK